VTITLDVTDTTGAEASGSVTVAIVDVVSLTITSLPAGTSGQPYTAALNAINGVQPYAWVLAAGPLPSGLTFSCSGVISGTPKQTGTFNLTFLVADSVGGTAQQSLSLVINAPPPSALSITTSSLPQGTKGKSYSTTLSASGGTTPYTWALASGSLPPGLSLTAGTGKISGTPTSTGTFSFTVKVTDAKGATATKSLSLTIASSSSGTTSVDIKGSITAINIASKYLTVSGVNIYYNSNTTFLLNTDSGQITSTGALPAGTTVGMAIEGKGSKDSTGKITATSLEIN
jgi:hypothetical protein